MNLPRKKKQKEQRWKNSENKNTSWEQIKWGNFNVVEAYARWTTATERRKKSNKRKKKVKFHFYFWWEDTHIFMLEKLDYGISKANSRLPCN